MWTERGATEGVQEGDETLTGEFSNHVLKKQEGGANRKRSKVNESIKKLETNSRGRKNV